MKKFIKISFFAILATVFVACNNETITVTDIMLNQTTATIVVGEPELNLVATVLPLDAANSALTWTSGNPAVATVTAAGVVTAVSEGVAAITARAQDGSNISAVCIVTVLAERVPATHVTTNRSPTGTFTLAVDSVWSIVPTVHPSNNVTNRAVTWSSSDTDVATVNANGMVTARGAGTAIITVTTVDGGHTATVPVTVVAVSATGLTALTAAQRDILMSTGATFTLFRPVVTPHNATNRTITWTSNNPDVAAVDATSGVVTTADNVDGVARVTITATTEDGGHSVTYNIIIAATPAGCNTANVTNFVFGAVTFASADVWTVDGTGGRPTQIWSDVVRENRCNGRTAFNGGGAANANTDCRRAENSFEGNYFTWCMVMRFADLLCPDDWRVPTAEDFAILHQNLGYSAPTSGSSSPMIPGTYMGDAGTGSNAVTRGGIWGGARFTGNATDLTVPTSSAYWSSTSAISTGAAYSLSFSATTVFPQGNPSKNNGFALRCVRNN